jgi:beta-phosphoglucomutase-like phosphatase (HAD superfamily)
MKQEVKNSADLRDAINQLELKTHVQEVQIKDHYENIKENLRPENLVKNTYSRLAQSPEIRRTLAATALGLVIGYASKKVHEVLSEQSMDGFVHSIVNAGLTKLEKNDPQGILSKGIKMLRQSTSPESPMYRFISYKR